MGPVNPGAAGNGGPDRQQNWSQQLERQRMQMAKERGMTPGSPEDQAAVRTKQAQEMLKKGMAIQQDKKSKDRPQLPMLLRAFVSFLPPSVLKEMEEKGAKPVAEALWKVHELFVGTVKLSPFSLLTAGAFHAWWYAANFKNTEGLPKLGVADLFRLIAYDSAVLAILALLLFCVVLIVMIAYAIMNPREFMGLISGAM